MKRLILSFFLFLSLTGFSQNLLNNDWQFKTGDTLIWKNIDFNSSTWKIIRSGRPWEDQGYANYDGFGWYRKMVVIPSVLKKDALKYNGLSLQLGTIDDADQVYFNGKLIGASGELPPHYLSGYYSVRNYTISPEKILWDKENVIAVRVYDGGGTGGLLSEVSLKVNGLESLVDLKPQFPRDDRLFLDKKTVEFPLDVTNSSKFNVEGELKCIIISDFKDTISVSKESVKISAKTSKTLKINKGEIAPGFYTIYFDFKSKLFNISKSFNIGVEPEKIVSPTDRPTDFDNFWMRAKRELAAVDPQFKMIRKDSLCTDKRDVFLVEMRSLDNVLIRGWYARPKATGKYPALLHVQGYSGNMQISLITSGEEMPEFFLNIRGHGNSRDEVNPGFPGYILHNIKDRERYIYRGAYMDCIRAVDFLCSREEVDSRYLVVEGGSQGGALSFATAALDNQRIKLCMPAVPFLSDFPDYFKIAKWPANEFTDYENANKVFGWNGIFETLSYFDIKNLAPWIKCPVFMQIGLKDPTCPPHINFAAYNQLSVPKSYIAYPEAGHGLLPIATTRKYEWMKKELIELKSADIVK